MLWKKKQMVAKADVPKAEKLPGPRGIPELVGKYLVVEMKMEPDLVPIL